MEDVILRARDEISLRGKVSDISPMGIECDVELSDMQLLRNDAGKYRQFDLEMTLTSHSGRCSVSGSGVVYSVRRISQSRCMVTIRFSEIEQNGYRLISEHLAPNPVVDLEQARSVRQSRMA